jgi:hypothetical protein
MKRSNVVHPVHIQYFSKALSLDIQYFSKALSLRRQVVILSKMGYVLLLTAK